MSKHFIDKSRNIRKKLRQNIKNEIIKEYYDKGRLFTTNHYVTPESWWIDICFLGKDKATFYSCALTTCRMIIQDKASDLAYAEAESIVPYNSELEGYDLINKHNGLSQLEFRKQAYKKLDGLTRFEWCQKREQELLKHVDTTEYIKLDYSYSYAIGMHASINRILNTDSINQFIIDFIKNDEKAYTDNKVISLDNTYIPNQMPNFKTEEESTEYHIKNSSIATREAPKFILDILKIR